jgi:tetratricopeptide (TPR) repeat protein
MEKDNKVYESIHRRKALAEILGIPLVLLGIGDIKDLTTQKIPVSETGKETDINALDSRLDFLYDAFNAGINPQHLRSQLDSAIYSLSTSKNKDALVLLSKYYRLYSRLERDMQNMQMAIDYIKRAEEIAIELKDSRLFSISMHSHGWILEEQNKIKQAIPYIEKGHKFVKKDITSLAGCSYIDLGLILSRVTQDHEDKEKVEALLDKAEEISNEVLSNKEKDGMLTPEVIHVNKAKAYLNMGMLDKSTDEIEKADSYFFANHMRRSIKFDIIQAKHAFLSGDILICLTCLEKAFVASKYADSPYNIYQAKELIKDIQTSKYANIKEVKKTLTKLH